MSSGSGGSWAKRLVILMLVVGAATWGFIKGMPHEEVAASEQAKQLKKLTVKNFAAAIAAEDVLVVVNLKRKGSEESKSLEEFFEELKRRDVYSDQVLFAEVDGDANPELAEQMGADPNEEAKGFVGFYAGGKKLGELVGETDRQVVQSEIERHLKGLIMRTGPGWLPEVEGMTPISSGR